MIRRNLQLALLIPLVFTGSLLTGCENDWFSMPGRIVNAEKIQLEIRNMNPRELDLCKVEIGSPRSLSSTGSSSANPTTSNPNSQADVTAWNNQLNKESQLFGNDGSASSASGNQGSNTQSPAPSTNNGITSIVILQRADPSFALINISPSSSKAATLSTRGIARITTFDARGRQTQEVVDENVEVRLVYNLSSNSGSWRCVTVNATPVSTPGPSGGKPKSSGRIGW